MRLVAIALLVTCVTAGAADAQDRGSRTTREFVTEAAQSDTFEMMEASSALAESHDPQVIAFANQMLRDHGATSAALASAAAKSDLDPPPMQMSTGQASFLAALQSARGATFDKVYWHQQALGHRAALVVEQRYADAGDTPSVQAAARQAIPIIQAHLAMAEKMDMTTGE